MDLVFNALPDVFSYQSLRHATYDAPWLNDPADNKGGGRRTPPQQQQQQQPATRRTSSSSCSGRDARDSCPLCQEKQRRPLATYIRSKSRQDRKEDASIQEEVEEEEAEQQQGEAVAAANATAASAVQAGSRS